DIRDRAQGGIGGSIGGQAGSTGTGGAGGSAMSTAIASNAGASNVFTSANATGGTGGAARGAGEVGGTGGDATADASGSGLGSINVDSTATGGTGGTGNTGADHGLGGNAYATAQGTGANGNVTSTATAGRSTDYLVNDMRSSANAQVDGSGTSQATAQYNGMPLSVVDAVGVGASALLHGAPDGDSTLAVLYTNTADPSMPDSTPVHANFDVTGTLNNHTFVDSAQLDSDVFAVGVLGGTYPSDGVGNTRTLSTDIDFDVTPGALQASEQNLLVGFINPVLTGNAAADPDFQVTLTIQREGATIESQTFDETQLTQLMDFFNGRTHDYGALNLAGLSGSELDIRVDLDVRSSSPGVGFVVDTIIGNSTLTERATPYVTNTVIDTGESHVGDVVLANLNVVNTAAAGSDGANAQFAGTTGSVVTSGGPITGLAPQASDNTTLQVGVDTSASGVRGGTATVALSTDGTQSGNAEAFANAEVQVSGTVYELAGPQVNNAPIAFGNVHVGDSVTAQALSITNTALDNGFGENLNASFGSVDGTLIANGMFEGLAAQATDATSMTVAIDTSSAGNKSGTANIDFVSDPDGMNSLGQTSLGSQGVSVTGAVYRLAEATIDNPLAFDFGNVHVGDSLSQAVSITNSAVADAFSEGLDASFGAASDARILNNAGTVSVLGAGATDNSSLVVSIDTGASGSINGTQTIDFASNGAGTSGLGITALPSQDLSVMASITATAFNLADPVVNNAQPVAFGNFREGDLVTSQAVSISNDAPDDGFSEALNASVGGTSGGVTSNGGSFTLLGPQATNDTAITVAIDTSVAGDKSGDLTLDFVSDGTGSSGLGQTPLASQDVAVTGAVYRLADIGVTPNPVVLNARVGDTAEQVLTVSNTAAADGYSEQLAVTGRSDSGDVTSSGMIGGLVDAGASDMGINVSLDTTTSGAKSGSVTFSAESDGSNTSGFTTNVALPDEVVAVTGNVWQAATADVGGPIDFGIVHVGDAVSAAISVANTATGDLVDSVRGGLTAVGGAPFSGSGDLGSGVAAGATDSSSLVVGLDTGAAGIFTGTATVDLASHNPDLADLDLGETVVDLSAQVNNYANPVFEFIGGNAALSGSGTSYVLDFGSVVTGSLVDWMAELAVVNDVTGPADLVDGMFDLAGIDDFMDSGFVDFVALGAGDAVTGLMLQLDTTLHGPGVFTDTILLGGRTYNAGGYDEALTPITLLVRGEIVGPGGEVPVPAVLWLVLAGLPVLRFVTVRRRRQR
ncbi:MAG: choice-of-anchor D domain-containing protein, partial [Gammaproteobacteria bacterium]|nr:choice-of-anchor D domain-containing protein [Gammaproteobacteria bacterium]